MRSTPISIGTSGSDRGSDSDASDCGGMTLREAQQLVNKRRAEHPGRLDERFGSGMRVKTKLAAPSSPLATIPSSPTIHRNRADSSSSGEGEGLAGPSPRSPLDRAAARDARLESVAASGGSPKAAPRPATIALLTPAVSSDNLPSSPSPRTRLHRHHPSPGVIDEIAPAAACAPPDDAASERYVDIEAGVREIIAREEATPATTTAGGWADGSMDDDEANREEVSGPKDPTARVGGVRGALAVRDRAAGAGRVTRIVAWREACT